MPAAFYALSFEDTGLIVGYCQLGKRDLTKAGAASALLDQLVGEKLVLSLGLKVPPPNPGANDVPSLTLLKTQLRVDEVKVPDANADDFTKQPWTYLLDLSDPTAKPGDGTVKQLQLDPTKVITAPGTLLGHPHSGPPTGDHDLFRVVMSNGVQSNTTFYAILDGQLASQTVQVPVQNSKNIDFPFVSEQGSYHTVLFASRGVKPIFGVIAAG